MMKTTDKHKMKRWAFRRFFEGWTNPLSDHEYGGDPIIDIPVKMMDINDFEIFEFDEGIAYRITLGRPGILIGKAGRVIDELEKWLTKEEGKQVKIYLIESKLW